MVEYNQLEYLISKYKNDPFVTDSVLVFKTNKTATSIKSKLIATLEDLLKVCLEEISLNPKNQTICKCLSGLMRTFLSMDLLLNARLTFENTIVQPFCDNVNFS